MNSRLRKDILTETYKDMRGIVSETAFRFWKSHGGDLDDLKAQANLIFIYAIDDYDSSKGTKLSTFIAYRIKKRLLDYMRSGYVPMQSSIGLEYDDDDFQFDSKSNENLSVMELLDEMEQDAHIVLCLFLSTPKEVIESIFDGKNFRNDHTGGHIRNRLRNRLRQMGWKKHRIREAFAEIKNVTSY